MKRIIFYLVAISILFYPFFLFAHEGEKGHKHPEEKKQKKGEEKKEIIIKIKPFYTANSQILVSGININPSSGTGDFQLLNNTARNITHIFARVFRYEEVDGKKRNFRLVNNPNKSGTILSGVRHTPQREAVWRFMLFKSRLTDQEGIQFTIAINSKSLFFE